MALSKRRWGSSTLCRHSVDSHVVCGAQPKLWTELQAGIECLTQLLALLEAMASTSTGTNGETELHEAAALLQQQIIYNGQVLDAALDGLRVYKDGTQSLTFLSSSVHLAYALMRMLEKWAKKTGDGSYVRKRTKPKRKRNTNGAYVYAIRGTAFFKILTDTENPPGFSSERKHGGTGWCSRSRRGRPHARTS